MSEVIPTCEGLDLDDQIVRRKVFAYIHTMRRIGDAVFEVTEYSTQIAEKIGACQFTRENAPQVLLCARTIASGGCSQYSYESVDHNDGSYDFLVQPRVGEVQDEEA